MNCLFSSCRPRPRGQARAQQLDHEGYQEMGRKGGLASNGQSADERIENEGD